MALTKISPDEVEPLQFVDPSEVEPLSSADYAGLVKEAANQLGVPKEFALALHSKGEQYRPDYNVSPKGATGPMQVMPDTFTQMANRLGIENPDINDPWHNSLAGVAYAKDMLKLFNNDPILAGAAYNAGPGAVKKYGGIPPFPETQGYVERLKKALSPSEAYAAEIPPSGEIPAEQAGYTVDVRPYKASPEGTRLGGLSRISPSEVEPLNGQDGGLDDDEAQLLGMTKVDPEDVIPAQESFLQTQLLSGKTPQEAQALLSQEQLGLEDTATNPAEIIAGGVGGVGSTLIGRGGAVISSLVRGAVSGAAGIPSQFAIEPVSQKIQEKTGVPAIIPSMALGLASGATIEPLLEKGIIKGAQKVAGAIPEPVMNALANEHGALVLPGKQPVPTPDPTLQPKPPAAPITEAPVPTDVLDYRNRVLASAKELVDKVEKVDQLGKYVDSINVDRISTEDEAKKLMSVISSQLQPHINKQRRGKMSLDEIKERAMRSGLTEEQLLKLNPGKVYNAEDGIAASMLNAASITNLMRKQKALLAADSNGTLTDQMIVDYHRAWERHRIIQSADAGIATEQGRALSARRIIVSPEMQAQKNLKAMVDALGGRELTVEMAKRMAMIDPTDTFAINRFIRDLHKATTFDKIYEVWINALLSSPTTHAANIISNSLTALTRVPEHATAATLELANAMLGRPRNKYIGEVASELFGLVHGLRVGWKAAKFAFINEMSMSNASKLETNIPTAIQGPAGKLVRIPSRFLIAADEFFKGVNYTADIYSLAFRKATQKGLTGAEKANEISRLIANPTTELEEAARKEMLYRVFQQQFGPVMMHIAQARDKDPTKILRFILPFLKTPTNIAKYALERTPLGFFHLAAKALQKDLQPGQAADEASRALIGTMLGAMAFQAVNEGYITGSGPKDKGQRDALYRTGWQPYSIKNGNQWVSYQRFEPISSVIGMAADLSEGIRDMKEDERINIVSSIIKSVGTNITSKTFMKGMSNALQAWSDPERYGNPFVEGLAGSVIPSSVASIARSEDPYVRDTKGTTTAENLTNYVKGRVPGLRDELPVKRDIWGRPIEQAGSALTRGVVPVPGSDIHNDPIDMELARLRFQGTITEMSRKIKHQLGEIELTPQQYESLQIQVGQMARPLIEKIVLNPGYRNLTDPQKISVIKSAYDKVSDTFRNLNYWQQIIQKKREGTLQDIKKSPLKQVKEK